jgi:hypothetical protein
MINRIIFALIFLRLWVGALEVPSLWELVDHLGLKHSDVDSIALHLSQMEIQISVDISVSNDDNDSILHHACGFYTPIYFFRIRNSQLASIFNPQGEFDYKPRPHHFLHVIAGEHDAVPNMQDG